MSLDAQHPVCYKKARLIVAPAGKIPERAFLIPEGRMNQFARIALSVLLKQTARRVLRRTRRQ